jgi:hypothetical protein
MLNLFGENQQSIKDAKDKDVEAVELYAKRK